MWLANPAFARTFNSTLKLKVYARSSGEIPDQLLGFTPSHKGHPVHIPPKGVWYVRPIGAFDAAHLTLLARLAKEEQIPGLDLSDHWELSNASLSNFTSLPSLVMLDISRTKISDIGLLSLKRSRHLSILMLPSAITDEGLSTLKSLHELKEINLDQTHMTDKGLGLLVRLATVQNLDLSSTRVTDAGVALLKNLPRLDRLVLGAAITDAAAPHLAALKNLKEIDISQTQIGEKGLAALGMLPGLQTVYLPRQVTEAGLKGLARSPSLRVLDLTRSAVSDDGIKALSKTQTLQEIALGQTSVTNACLPYLATLSSLRMLELSDTQITSAGLAPLAQLKKLEVLSLSWQKLTREDLQGMAQLKQLKAIVLNGVPLPEATMVQLRRLGTPSPWESISGLESAALRETKTANPSALSAPVPTPDTKLAQHAIPQLTDTAYHPAGISSSALPKTKGSRSTGTALGPTAVAEKKGMGLQIPAPAPNDLKVASLPSRPEPIALIKSTSSASGQAEPEMHDAGSLKGSPSFGAPSASGSVREKNTVVVTAPIAVTTKASEENLLQVIALQSNPAHAGGFGGLSGMRQLRQTENQKAINTISAGGRAAIQSEEDTPENSLGEITVGAQHSH